MAETHKLVDVSKGYRVTPGQLGGWIVTEGAPEPGFASRGQAAFSRYSDLLDYLIEVHKTAPPIPHTPA